MVRVHLELKDNQWNEVETSKFWLHEELLIKLRNLEKIQKKGWDGVIIVDGKERSGKSKLAMTMGWYFSKGALTEKNFASGLNDAAEKIAELPDSSVIIVDEGSLMFSSKDSSTAKQKLLIKLLDVVGQKNLIFIICLPCFFDLNKTIAVRRSLFLLHVYPDMEYNRGRFVFFGESTKAKLYKFGKKNFDSYAYPQADFQGDYLDFTPPFYEQYLEIIKKKSLDEALTAAKGSKHKVSMEDLPKEVELGMKVNYMKRILERKPEITAELLSEVFNCQTLIAQKVKRGIKEAKMIEIAREIS